MRKLNLIIGICLLIFGVVLLIVHLGISPISLVVLWPTFPILIGILFLSFYFTDQKKVGFIMPGVILVLIGATSFICTLTTWDNMKYLWPMFILSPGLGFFWTYFAGTREKFQIIWGSVLSIVALVFFFIRAGLEILWPIVLMVIGLIFIFLYVGRRETDVETEQEQIEETNNIHEK